ncbi:hypothetical protein [Lysobacter antibioticus]|uniref:hypothetical protein n=1 Tax=Lysobacter antibioticus TaxID=84531 RepID=UPI00068CB7E9|nr:hypothetical protein [Lysobacter antibioticus]
MTLLERCVGRPASELAEFTPEQLLELTKQASDALATAKANADLVDRAVDLRYGRQAASARLAAGKDTGTVRLTDGVVRISVELPKKVEWDQARLGRIVERIRAAGEDPAEFVETTYRISETRYGAWSAAMRSSFDPARTLKAGKQIYRLSVMEDES